MRLTFLGSGGAFCDFRVNYQNNAVIETAVGPVLLDCGVTALQSLREIGVSPHDVQAVLITHVHADHASPQGLVGERYYGARSGEGPSYEPTRIVAPGDVLDPLMASVAPYLDDFQDRSGRIAGRGTPFLIRSEAATRVEIGGVSFTYFRVPHVVGAGIDKPAYGLEIADATSRIVWSGDTTFHRDWIERQTARSDVDALFHECTFVPPGPAPVHTPWVSLRDLPPEVLARTTLMHHTEVPSGVDLGATRGAAARHEVFTFGRGA